MDIVFIKQGITSYGHIEAGIGRAAAGIEGLRLDSLELAAHYRAQPEPLRSQPHPARMRQAVVRLHEELLRSAGEVVLLLNGFVLEWYRPGFFAALKKAGKTVVGWQIDDPYYIDHAPKFAADLDLVPTVDSAALPVYAGLGAKARFLPLACDPALHRDYGAAAARERCDVSFIGAPFGESRRTRLIDELAVCLPKYDTRIAGATDIDSWRKGLRNFAALAPCIHDARVSPEEAARFFSASRINLNIHKDSYGHPWDQNAGRVEGRSPCERTFAIAGCGGFQLIDDTRPDLAGLFVPGRELVTFADAADLAAKIDYYLAHDGERREIARAGQARAYAGHTYLHRLKAILGWL